MDDLVHSCPRFSSALKACSAAPSMLLIRTTTRQSRLAVPQPVIHVRGPGETRGISLLTCEPLPRSLYIQISSTVVFTMVLALMS